MQLGPERSTARLRDWSPEQRRYSLQLSVSPDPEIPAAIGPTQETRALPPAIDLKANNIGPLDGGDVVSCYTFEMAPRARLVAQIMLRDADHLLASQPIERLGAFRSENREPLRQGQSNAMPTARRVKEPKAPERAQPILGIIKAFRKLEGLCPGRANLGNNIGNLASVKCQRRAERRVELHLAARVPARSRSKSGERLLGAAAALL